MSRRDASDVLDEIYDAADALLALRNEMPAVSVHLRWVNDFLTKARMLADEVAAELGMPESSDVYAELPNIIRSIEARLDALERKEP